MGVIEEVEKETILDKDLDYFFSSAKKLYGLRNYCRLMLGKLAVLAMRKFADGNFRSAEGQAILSGLTEDLGIKKGTLFQYVQLWRRLGKVRDFSSLPYSAYRKAAFQNRPSRVLERLKRERRAKK